MSDKLRTVSNFNNSSSLGITEDMIRIMVHSFYAQVQKDPLIGPIFAEKITNWDKHLELLCDFWASIALGVGRYKGQPLMKHVGLPNLQEEHFARWLELFKENANKTCSKEAAGFFIDRANKIADSLMRGIAFYRGEGIL